MDKPTVTIALDEFNELRDALDAAIMFRNHQLDSKSKRNKLSIGAWERDLKVWRDMRTSYSGRKTV